MAKNKVFVDSSVLIAAILSSGGGSFYILNILKDNFDFIINEFIFEETLSVLNKKEFRIARQALHDNLFLLFGTVPIRILGNPPGLVIKRATEFINEEDAPVLAGAAENSTYLITLDDDFFTRQVLDFAEQYGLEIMKPKEFINEFRA